MTLLTKIQTLKQNRPYQSLKGIIAFIIITLSIHLCYRFWAYTVHYFPITEIFLRASAFMENSVIKQTSWMIVHILRTPIILEDHTIWLPNQWGISIGEGCTGLKQFIQVFLLFLIYPGPWKHKLWFIPAGIIIIHITNITRITLLALSMNLNLPHIHFIHNQILRIFFYIVIFAMWYFWAEKICKKKPEEKSPGLQL